jgi:hypothetical protein
MEGCVRMSTLRIQQRCMRRGLLVACLISALVPVAALAQLTPTDAPEVEFDGSPDTVVVSLIDAPGELAEPAGATSVKVYGDGRVEVHYPPYMKRAGDYTLQLEQEELRSLVRSVAGRGLVEFDPDAIRAAKRRSADDRRALRRARGATGPPPPQISSDGTVSRLELRLRRYRKPGAAAEVRDVRKQIRWHGLRSDARRHGEIGALGELEAARQELRALGRRGALERRR